LNQSQKKKNDDTQDSKVLDMFITQRRPRQNKTSFEWQMNKSWNKTLAKNFMEQTESLAQAYVSNHYIQHQFLSIYSWLHVLAMVAIIRPFINVDTGKHIYCIKVEISFIHL